MTKRFRLDHKETFFIVSAGWLFADLLLALAMLFLAANTFAIKPLPPKPTPTPTQVLATPTPIPLPRLELKFHEFSLNVDPNGLLNNDPAAIASVKQQVKAQAILNGRSVGLVIAYGGAPGDNDIGTAQAVAGKVYDVLKILGKERFAFGRASYYSTLYLLGGKSTIVVLDVYLFAE
jgi:hypothetical protein